MDLSRSKVAIVYGTAGRHWRPEREIEALRNGLKQRDVKEPAVLPVRDVVRGKADSSDYDLIYVLQDPTEDPSWKRLGKGR